LRTAKEFKAGRGLQWRRGGENSADDQPEKPEARVAGTQWKAEVQQQVENPMKRALKIRRNCKYVAGVSFHPQEKVDLLQSPRGRRRNPAPVRHSAIGKLANWGLA